MSVQEFNYNVVKWGNTTRRRIKLRVFKLINSKGNGYARQNVDVKRYMGEASKINFSFPYYMVFVHKGAGRGYAGSKSGLFTRGKGAKGITNPKSMGKMGTGKRIAKPWFNPVIEQNFPELAEIVADHNGEKIVAKIQKILIK